MNMFGSKASTCGNVNDIAGGRKTINTIVEYGGTEAVLVSVDRDDAVIFSDDVEVESVPSLDDSEYDDEEEEEEDWESDEESLSDDEGE